MKRWAPRAWGLWLVAAAAALVVGQSGEAVGEPTGRVALVIGNGAYGTRPLRNPVSDARLVGATLTKLGFGVEVLTDLDQKGMKRAIQGFGTRLTQAGANGLGLFFFSGHGIQAKGVNYLLPIGSEVSRESDLAIEGVDARWVLGTMEEAGAGVNLMFLDACRDNPFEGTFRSARRGLERMDAPTGSVIAYATAPGKVAEDGDGVNSPYTAGLVGALGEPGLTLEEVLKRTRIWVMQNTHPPQVPWESSSLVATVILNPARGSGVGSVAAQADGDASACAAMRRHGGAEGARIYLQGFPNGICAVEARIMTAAVVQPAPVPRPSAPPPGIIPVVGVWPQPQMVFKDCADCPEMVIVPPGSFRMGAPTKEHEAENLEKEYRAWEQPEHSVTIDRSFAVSKYEVTVEEFGRFAKESDRNLGDKCWTYQNNEWKERQGYSWQNPGFSQGPTHPVVCINWDDARAFAAWLSEKVGQEYRLLSEAEWEYTARAGTTTARYWGDRRDGACRFANGADQSGARANNWDASKLLQCDDKYAQTAPVGRFEPNRFGLRDMLGNVWEWVEDCWHGNYQDAPPDGSAWTATCGSSARVLRGGSWYDVPRLVRSAYRTYGTPDARDDAVGFRLARTLNLSP